MLIQMKNTPGLNSTLSNEEEAPSTVKDYKHNVYTKTPQNSGPGPINQFKLISVNFKEAALDSPTFRASVNHLDIQIDNIEKWLQALLSSVKKFPKYIKEFQSLCNSFLEHLVPTFLQDGLIDQEYTVQALHTSLSGLKNIWSLSLLALNVDTYAIENLNIVISKNVAHYKELRRTFQLAQEKYDKYLSLYLSTSKTKDPLIVIEDAKQLYEVRKEYVHASLELIIELSTLGNLLDRMLVRLCSDIWSHKAFAQLEPSVFFTEQLNKIQKIQSWCDSYSIAIDKLNSDMLSAKLQVEESSKHQFAPSSNPDSYKSSLINYNTLNDIDEKSLEKHGYLFMKTYKDKSSRPVWVRRWVFVKNGIFGLLVLSPSKTFVQETDKIGVLLCKIKYNPNEDRRFCFEVKTNDITLQFQAETLLELKSWLKVFENQRKMIKNDPELFSVASGRYPPIISELSSTVNTTTDRELTSIKTMHSSGQIITSSNLSAEIEKNEKYFTKHLYYQIPQIRPPFLTDTTKSSIISYYLAIATSGPTALTANIWGSVNWGLYYLHNSLSPSAPLPTYAPDQELLKLQKEHEFDSGLFYPDYYPNELVPMDIQMRALFETAIDPAEYCLISYRCIWSPNSRQELSGRCFMTNDHIYLYTQALGFVSLFKGYIQHLVSVESSSQKFHDSMKIYTANGVIRMKLFLDDATHIRKKLVYLISNKASDNPKPFSKIVPDLLEIDEQVRKEKLDQKKRETIKTLMKELGDTNQRNQALSVPAFLEMIRPESASITPAITSKSIHYKTDFSRDYKFVFSKTYNAPPKAIFHALLGDNSLILRDQIVFGTLEAFTQQPWSTVNGHLMRKYNAPVKYNRKIWKLQVEQVIDAMEDDRYYTFTNTKSTYEFILGSRFFTQFRYVIVSGEGKKSRVFSYSRRIYLKNSLLNPLIDILCQSIAVLHGQRLNSSLDTAVKEIGTHGMIVKSIYLFGKLSHTEKAEEIETPETVRLSLVGLTLIFVYRFNIRVLAIFSQIGHNLLFGLIKLAKSISMQGTLLFLILLSVLFNLFLMGKTTVSFWTVRKANQIAYDFMRKEPVMLERAIYMKDYEEFLNLNEMNIGNYGDFEEPFNSSSKCLTSFKQKSFVTNFKNQSYWSSIYGDDTTKEIARGLQQTFHEIGMKRHKLMVDLKILNEMEQEIVKAEWKNWLMNELQRCLFVRVNVLQQVQDNFVGNDSVTDGVHSLIEYCLDCAEQWGKVDLI